MLIVVLVECSMSFKLLPVFRHLFYQLWLCRPIRMHAHKMQAYEVHANDMQAYEMHASNIHALWVTRLDRPPFATNYSQKPFLAFPGAKMFPGTRPGDTDPLQHIAV
jgi:hypothetical protein